MNRSGERTKSCHRRGSRKELSGNRTDRGRNSGKPHCGTDEAIPQGRIFQVRKQSAPCFGALCFSIKKRLLFDGKEMHLDCALVEANSIFFALPQAAELIHFVASPLQIGTALLSPDLVFWGRKSSHLRGDRYISGRRSRRII